MHSQSLVGTKVSAVVMRKMTSIPDKEKSKRTFRDTLRGRGGKRRGRNNWKSEWKSTDGEEQMQSRGMEIVTYLKWHFYLMKWD